ncbi:MAG: hypothetical protein WBF34_30835 [Streptosporangiaceae bacterium]
MTTSVPLAEVVAVLALPVPVKGARRPDRVTVLSWTRHPAQNQDRERLLTFDLGPQSFS